VSYSFNDNKKWRFFFTYSCFMIENYCHTQTYYNFAKINFFGPICKIFSLRCPVSIVQSSVQNFSRIAHTQQLIFVTLIWDYGALAHLPFQCLQIRAVIIVDKIVQLKNCIHSTNFVATEMNKLMPVDWPDRLMSIIKASRLLYEYIPKGDCKIEKKLDGK